MYTIHRGVFESHQSELFTEEWSNGYLSKWPRQRINEEGREMHNRVLLSLSHKIL